MSCLGTLKSKEIGWIIGELEGLPKSDLPPSAAHLPGGDHDTPTTRHTRHTGHTYIRGEDHKNDGLPPTVQEIEQYIAEQKPLNPHNPWAFTGEDFYDYFQGKGWTDKHGTPIADWRAVARIWGRRTPKLPGHANGQPQRKPSGIEV